MPFRGVSGGGDEKDDWKKCQKKWRASTIYGPSKRQAFAYIISFNLPNRLYRKLAHTQQVRNCLLGPSSEWWNENSIQPQLIPKSIFLPQRHKASRSDSSDYDSFTVSQKAFNLKTFPKARFLPSVIHRLSSISYTPGIMLKCRFLIPFSQRQVV